MRSTPRPAASTGTFRPPPACARPSPSGVSRPLSDIGRISIPNSLATEPDPKVGGGLFALRLENGERAWFTPPPACGDRKRCSPAQSAAVIAIPGVVFSGSVDGHLRAFSTTTGAILWDVDTVGNHRTVNEIPARGGSLNGPGPAIAEEWSSSNRDMPPTGSRATSCWPSRWTANRDDRPLLFARTRQQLRALGCGSIPSPEPAHVTPGSTILMSC